MPIPLERALAEVTAGLLITVEHFRAELSQEDLADIEAGLIPIETLRAYAQLFSRRRPPPPAAEGVRCADCQHFERIDHPHMGRCAQGHGRFFLWDSDEHACEDFSESALEGD